MPATTSSTPLVAAVTAKLGCQDNAYKLRTLPECPPKDCEGLLMEMVYANQGNIEGVSNESSPLKTLTLKDIKC